MITPKNLTRAGFTSGKQWPLEGGGYCRTWLLPEVQPGLFIAVEEGHPTGKPVEMIPQIFSHSGETIFLKIDSVTKLIQLNELLSHEPK